METEVIKIAQIAKNASLILASLDTATKNVALEKIAEKLVENKKYIIEQNVLDLTAAEKLLFNGEISKAVFDRLRLSESKFNDMVAGVLDVKKLDDPINKILSAKKIDDGLELYKVSCPIGVIGVVFEARPDVIVQISSLAVKSSNAVILKGGKEANLTNNALANVISSALKEVEGFPENVINLVQTRDDVNEMLKLDKYIDLIIPRGGNKLVQFIKSNTKIPVLGHADGICHIFVSKNADFELAIKVCVDSKIQYPAACNAVETILIDEDISVSFLPKLVQALKENGVEVKGCEKCLCIVNDIEQAFEDDWKTEYGDKIVSIKIVKDTNEAIEHINTFGSGHTDCIISRDKSEVEKFMSLVDSAGVYNNVSTRFADGFRYGLGAEVGISTNKTHARGPVGLEGLTIYKYKLFGHGQIVAEYTGENAKKFLHEDIK